MPLKWILPLILTLIASGCAAAQTDGGVPAATSTGASRTATPQPAPPEPAAGTSPAPPPDAQAEFRTDFSRALVPLSEIRSGGPPKDGIPAIDHPRYVSVAEADAWLDDTEPVILVEVDGVARAYPIQILIWHEIVNDTLNGLPLAVTFCPLCNTAIAFERTLDGRVLDFGTTGRLRYSNLVMYDRQTETWWQQATGQAIVGELAGAQLTFYPAQMIAWSAFKAAWPDGDVLSRETGYVRNYGRNPYIGYDDVNRPPFLYVGPPTPGQLPPMARVLPLDFGDEAVAYPYDVLQEAGVVNDEVAGVPVVIFWQAGAASALDAGQVADGRDVGAATAFDRRLDGRTLTFAPAADGVFQDAETGSRWNALGTALSGPLAGQRLAPLPAINHFWFSWAAFRPETRIFQP